MSNTKEWIQTFTGKQFWPLKPKPEDVDIRDISHALAMQCRYNGHCQKYYSVAEHSVRISDVLPQDLKLWGLLHDSAEAYIGDMIRPIKQKADWFNEVEEHLLEVIAQHFNLPWPIPKEIWEADDRMLVTEVRDILAEPPVAWNLNAEPYFFKIDPLSPEEAERWFLSQYRKLTT